MAFYGSIGTGYSQGLQDSSNLRTAALQQQKARSDLEQAAAILRAQGNLANPVAQYWAGGMSQAPVQLPPMGGAPAVPAPSPVMQGVPGTAGLGQMPQVAPPPAPVGAGVGMLRPPIKPYTAPSAPPAAPQAAAGPAQIPEPPAQPQAPAPGSSSSLSMTEVMQTPMNRGLQFLAQEGLKMGLKGNDLFNYLDQGSKMMGGDARQQLELLKMAMNMQGQQLRHEDTVRGQDLRVGEGEANRKLRESEGEKGRAAAMARAKLAHSPKEKPAEVVYDKAGNQYVRKVVGDAIELTDPNGRKVDPSTVSVVRSAVAGRMLNVVENDIHEIDNALTGMKSFGASATATPFFADHASPGWADRWTKKQLSVSEQQQYDVYANRVSRAIAGLQTMGSGSGGTETAVKEARALVPQPGDDLKTVKLKLEQIQKLRDIGAKASGLLNKIGGKENVYLADSEKEYDTAPVGSWVRLPNGNIIKKTQERR